MMNWPLSTKNRKVIFGFALLIIASLSFLLRFWAYQKTNFANGWDAYFYLIQIKSLFEEGSMHSSDLSLIYPLLYIQQLIWGNYEFSYKINAAFLAASFTMSLAYAIKCISKSKTIILLVATFTLLSAHLTYFAAQYPKNTLGLCFFFMLIAQIPRLFRQKQTAKNWLIIIFFLLLNVFGHRMTFVLGLMFLSFFMMLKHISFKQILILLLIGGGISVIGLFLPGLFSLADFSRFDGMLSTKPQFSLLSFIQSFGLDRIGITWLIEIIGITIVALLPIYISIKQVKSMPSKFIIAWLLMSFVLIFPFYHWALDGIAFRFFLVFILLLPLIIGVAINQLSWHNKHISILIILFIGLSPLSINGYKPKLHDPPYGLYHTISSRIVEKLPTEDLELLIAHKSLAEYFTFTTGKDALPWIPEYPIDEKKLWRVAADLNPNVYRYYLPDASLSALSSNYYLVREDEWQQFLSILEKFDEKDRLLQLKRLEKSRPNSAILFTEKQKIRPTHMK